MNVDLKHLGSDRIQPFLDAELPQTEQAAIERHLEFCDECRQQLYASAADVTWWEDASDFLNEDEFESAGTLRNANVPTLICRAAESSAPVSEGEQKIPTDIRQIIAWLDPTDDPTMLGRLGGYEIAGVVGAGGMGVVLKGFDRSLNRYVAIKILAPHLASSGAARQRFGREAQAAAAVVHNNVIAIHGVDESNSLPYLVMPYLRGTSLQRRIDEYGALNISEILRLGMQTARGLSAAHDQGLVHRDVKPANILLDGTTERVLLTDFGLARAADDASLTRSGVIAGTPFYMSPEQAEGAAIDHRSDLFSLGSVIYTMCTGRPPFRADTSWGILRKVTDAQPRSIRDLNPDVPEWMCEVINRLHRKDPAQRIQTAHEVAEILEGCLAHVQQPNDFALPQQLVKNPASAPATAKTRAMLVGAAIVAFICAGFAWNAWHEWMGGQSGVDNAVSDSPAGIETTDVEMVDESLLDWDDGSAAELTSIRSAVEQLDEVTLQMVQRPNADRQTSNDPDATNN